MKAWDEKLTYQLSESELMGFVDELVRRDTARTEKEIHKLVDQVEAWWLNKTRGGTQWGNNDPFQVTRMSGTDVLHTPGYTWPGEMATITDVRIKMPDWVPAELVRYLAEMQIREQWGS